MQGEAFVMNDSELREQIQITADRLGINEAFVEKDYYVTALLQNLVPFAEEHLFIPVSGLV